MATDPENDNDRKLAVAITDAQTMASVAVATIQAEAGYAVAGFEAGQILTQADIASQAKSASAGIAADESARNADIEAELKYSNGVATLYEVNQGASIQVRVADGAARIEAKSTDDQSAAQVSVIFSEATQRIRSDNLVATIRSDQEVRVAQVEAAATALESSYAVQRDLGEAATRAYETASVSLNQVRELKATSAYEDQGTTYGSKSDAYADRAVSGVQHKSKLDLANLAVGADLYSAGRRDAIGRIEADSRFRLTTSGADQERAGDVFAATTRAAATRHDADDRYQAVAASEDFEDQRLSIALSYADAKFREVYPLIGHLGPPPTEPLTPGLLPWPATPTPGVFTPRMVQMRANAAYAGADAKFAVEYRGRQSDAAGRGLSPVSPSLDATRAILSVRSAREGIAAASESRIDSARKNRERVTQGQAQRGTLDAARNRVAVDAEGNAIDLQVGLLDGVASIISGIL